MQIEYPIIHPLVYTDHRGSEVTELRNDGKILSAVIRGIAFAGPDFDSLSATNLLDDTDGFTTLNGDLCSCTLKWTMPVPIKGGEHLEVGSLHARLELGDPRPGGTSGIDREDLWLRLNCTFGIFETTQPYGWFDDALGNLQALLPNDTHLLCCYNCALSHFFPAGYGLFGSLGCFRNQKAAARSARSKGEIFDLYKNMAEQVQETYLCREFEVRDLERGKL